MHGKNRDGELVMLAFEGAEILDIAGPLDILCAAPGFSGSDYDETTRIHPLLVSEKGGPQSTMPCGITIHSESFASLKGKKIDTLIVPGAYSMEEIVRRKPVLRWLRAAAKKARRVVSICTGAFLLAEAGLLDGKRVTTHWRHVEALARRYPSVQFEEDAIYVNDGKIFTSAGITAGMDLALHMVEQDYGAEVALDIARTWLLYVKRPGGQSQFSALLPRQSGERKNISELQSWIMENLTADLTVNALADRLAMSPRHFARVFLQETGITPARYVETVRLEAARRWLEESNLPLEYIADECGMGDSERLRRSFIRHLGVNPSDYRKCFARHRHQNLNRMEQTGA